MNRRALLQASVAASAIPLAGCSLIANSSSSEGTEPSSTSTVRSSLVGVTFVITGTAKRADGTYFYLDSSQYNDKVLKISVKDNAGPLIGEESDDGNWTYARQKGWKSIPQGTQVVATVRKTDAGELKAVKIFFNAICSFERPPES